MCNRQAISAIVHALDRDVDLHDVLLSVTLFEIGLKESWRPWRYSLLLVLSRRSELYSSVRIIVLLLSKISEQRYFLTSHLYRRRRSGFKTNVWRPRYRLERLQTANKDTSCWVISADRAMIPVQHRLLDVVCAFHRWLEHLVDLLERHLLRRCHV